MRRRHEHHHHAAPQRGQHAGAPHPRPAIQAAASSPSRHSTPQVPASPTARGAVGPGHGCTTPCARKGPPSRPSPRPPATPPRAKAELAKGTSVSHNSHPRACSSSAGRNAARGGWIHAQPFGRGGEQEARKNKGMKPYTMRQPHAPARAAAPQAGRAPDPPARFRTSAHQLERR